MAILNLSLLRPELISLQTTRKCGHLKFKMFQNFSKYPESKAMKVKYTFPLVFQNNLKKRFSGMKKDVTIGTWHAGHLIYDNYQCLQMGWVTGSCWLS